MKLYQDLINYISVTNSFVRTDNKWHYIPDSGALDT